MQPTEETVGRFVQWSTSYDFSLSAPILDFTISQLGNDAFFENARGTLEHWIKADNHNLDLIRAGLLRFRMPHIYSTNAPGQTSVIEHSRSAPDDELLERGIRQLREALNCIGSQLFHRKDLPGAVKAALLSRHLVSAFPQFLQDRDYPGDLSLLFHQLANDMPGVRRDYFYAGIDEIERIVHAAVPQRVDPPSAAASKDP